MKAVVDEEACVGCGLCEDTSPEVFQMDGDVAKVVVPEVPEDAQESCQQAADGCPVDAIQVED